MARVALYRKYRPADLSDAVGQDHIVKTLESSLQNGMLSHAYLFTGPRGTGKTSIARILARRVNGLDAATNNSAELDIIEIDAASNRGIDEIRALREKVATAPTTLKYKVYIIDEAHMLTREAANALLKTLEEPPAHVIFILATTEAHKLPETIISRSQRFDFRPLLPDVLVAQLRYIADLEKITIDDGALTRIAELAQGGLRDAIGLLDQLATSGQELSDESVGELLGIASSSELNVILTSANGGKAGEAVAALEQILQKGTPAQVLTTQLQAKLRQSLLSSEPEYSADFVVLALDLLAQATAQSKFSTHPSLPLELAVAKLATIIASKAQPAPAAMPAQPETLRVESAKSSEIEPPKATADNQESEESKQPEQKPDQSPQGSANQLDDTSQCAKGLSAIKEHNNSLYALLRSGGARLEGNLLLVDCRFNFHKERIEEHHNRQLVEKVMGKVCGRPIELRCQLQQGPEPVKKEEINTDKELVSSAMAILGGELVDD